jgi:transcriptional regulator GlxA family with amidase domain
MDHEEVTVEIVFFVFDGITPLDVIGPYQALARMPGARATFVGLARGTVRSDDGVVGLVAERAIADVTRADLLVVPGGIATRALEKDARVSAWLRAIDATTSLTTSVCTGALLLGAAGLLRAKRATTHWAARERLASYGAQVSEQRVVRDGKYATAAGVSAGIDLALTLARELHGDDVAAAIQLGIEYDPQPPLDAGDPRKAPAHVRDAVLARIRARETAARDA